MTLKRRIERAEQMRPSHAYAHLSDEELTAKMDRRTADWTAQDWIELWDVAREFGWSDQKIASSKAALGV